MATIRSFRDQIKKLKVEFDSLRVGRDSLLAMLDEVGIHRMCITQTLSKTQPSRLKETEKILLEQELGREVSIREVFEAKNLARVIEYQRANRERLALSKENILLLHQMLVGGIDDAIASRRDRKGVPFVSHSAAW